MTACDAAEGQNGSHGHALQDGGPLSTARSEGEDAEEAAAAGTVDM